MKRITLFLMLSLLTGLYSCQRTQVRNLVVTQITHFEVRGNDSSSNLPVFAGTLSVDEILRDVSVADYYQKKLAEVYKFPSFTLKPGAPSEILLDRAGDLKQPQKVFRYEDSTSVMEILLTSFAHGTGQYTFTVSDRTGKQVRNHTVDVPSGKSASIGTMFDRQKSVGQIIVITMRSLGITSQTTPAELAAFLREINSVPGDTTAARYTADDQRWMDELFGPGAMELAVERTAETDTLSREKRIAFDTAPAIIGELDVQYPAAAKRDTVQGRVVVELYVSKSGNPENCRVIKGVRPDLDSAAVDAVRRAKFTPASYQGNAIGVVVAIPIVFQLKSLPVRK